MKAIVLKSTQIKDIRHPMPKSLVNAAGMLRGKLPDGVAYQKTIRKEWGKRSSKRMGA